MNEIELRGKTVDEVCDILQSMRGTLTFLVVPTRQHVTVSPIGGVGRDHGGTSRTGVVHLKVIHSQCRKLEIFPTIWILCEINFWGSTISKSAFLQFSNL